MMYPISIGLELSTKNIGKENNILLYTTLVASSVCKNIAFVGPSGTHASCIVQLHKLGFPSNIMGTKAMASSSMGATVGIVGGLSYSYWKDDSKLAIPLSFLYPFFLYMSWRNILK
jgi:hypothetical protein